MSAAWSVFAAGPADAAIIASRHRVVATVMYDVRSEGGADEHGNDGHGDWVFRPHRASVSLLRSGRTGSGEWIITDILVRGTARYLDPTVGGSGPDMRYFGTLNDDAHRRYTPDNLDAWRPWQHLAADALDMVGGRT